MFTTLTSSSYTISSYPENQLKPAVSFHVGDDIPLYPLVMTYALYWVKDILLYWVTQENLIEFLLQSSLPYISFGDGPY